MMKRRTFLALGAGAALTAVELAGPETLAAARAGGQSDPDFIRMPEIDASKPMDADAFDDSQAGTAGSARAGNQRLLPLPSRFGGSSLIKALMERRSTRSFSSRAIADTALSDLLWAAWGVNRLDGKRTAPTRHNNQNADIYAALSDGIWLYNAQNNRLERKTREDSRAGLGGGPVVLIYAAPDDAFGAMTVGSLYQNVGLYCASTGLGNIVRASKVSVAQKALQISDEYRIWVTQAVGWPG